MKAVCRTAFLVSFLFFFAPCQALWIEPFVSEIHYDNAGADTGEFVAVTVPAGWDLSGWQLDLYNGSNGGVYHTESLSGSVAAGATWREFWWPISGMQNSAEAVALVSVAGQLIDFVAYEGSFPATGGPAVGATPRLLPVSESSATLAGWSLQRLGSASDWDWIAAAASPGDVNLGLHANVSAAVATPPLSWLWLAAVPGFAWSARRRNCAALLGKCYHRRGALVDI